MNGEEGGRRGGGGKEERAGERQERYLANGRSFFLPPASPPSPVKCVGLSVTEKGRRKEGSAFFSFPAPPVLLNSCNKKGGGDGERDRLPNPASLLPPFFPNSWYTD